jgi:hypothetical protein
MVVIIHLDRAKSFLLYANSSVKKEKTIVRFFLKSIVKKAFFSHRIFREKQNKYRLVRAFDRLGHICKPSGEFIVITYNFVFIEKTILLDKIQ